MEQTKHDTGMAEVHEKNYGKEPEKKDSRKILFFDTERGKDAEGNTVEKRVIRTRASSCYDAGTRWQLPDSIPLDYQEFIKAYKESTPVEQPTSRIVSPMQKALENFGAKSVSTVTTKK